MVTRPIPSIQPCKRGQVLPRLWPPGPLSLIRPITRRGRSEEHTSELQSRPHLVCRLLLEKKKRLKYCISLVAVGGKRTSARVNLVPCSVTKKRDTEWL